MKKIFLKNRKDASVRRFHPWVFSGAIQRLEGAPHDGDLVDVFSNEGEYLATGHYHAGSISVRIISFRPTVADQGFWVAKLSAALRLRQQLGLPRPGHTDSFRLIHAEGDGLPGLIIDIYGPTAVMQCHSIGMHRERDNIARALLDVFEGRLEAIFDKSKDTLPPDYAQSVQNGYLFGLSLHKMAREYSHSFLVDWEEGQKTGFFLDQRENRHLVAHYAADKEILNAYCYTGGFSVYALKAGARHVDSVDVSARAIELTERNVALNQLPASAHQAHTSDVLSFLRQTDRQYDLIVVDPPAFAKNLQKRHNAVQGYKRLNALALKHVRNGGLLFTFSCSQVVDRSLFYHTIVAAALEADRKVRVLHHLNQPPDHPVSLFHPEGEYLKGLVLYVGED